MKMKFYRRTWGFTFLEVMVIIGILCVLTLMLLPALSRPRRGSQLGCFNNQKQILLAFKQWGLDQNDKYPMQVSVTSGGTMEKVNWAVAWPHFQVMSNELNTPRVLVCPKDETRLKTSSFESGFTDGNISYFVGVDASETTPTAMLIGDSNLTLNGTNLSPGLVTLATNAQIGWTREQHVKQGHIGLADGSVLTVTTPKLREVLQATGLITNRLILP